MSEADLPLIDVPTSVEHLNDLVIETVVARWNSPPITRSPGVFAMRFPTIAVLISTEFDPPAIEVSGSMVSEIGDLEAAYANVNVLNGGFPAFKFVIQEDTLLVKKHVQALPYIPDHLFIALSAVTDLSRDLGVELVRTFGGRSAL